MMKSFDLLAYTADADVLCPDCAAETYGFRALGTCPECHRYVHPEDSECDDCGADLSGYPNTDGEGNPVSPVFAENSGEWAESGLYCGACGEEIIPADAS